MDITIQIGERRYDTILYDNAAGRFMAEQLPYTVFMTKGEIDTALEDCGINQTRHLIRVHVRAKILIVLPGENAQVETEITVPLGERVLVGDVPEIFLDTLGAG